MSEDEIRHNLVVMLAGRAAEKLIYDEFTVGAQNDLERATSMARRMVTAWGMSKKLGPVSYKMTDEDPFLGREMHQSRQFSEHTMEMIDAEVTQILQEASKEAFELLGKFRDELKSITDGLLAKEELDRKEITELIGASVHAEKRAAANAEKPEANQSEDSDSAESARTDNQEDDQIEKSSSDPVEPQNNGSVTKTHTTEEQSKES